MAEGWRDVVLRAARRSGAEPALRRVQRMAMDSESRRNAVDEDHLTLALAFGVTADAVCVDVGANLGTMLEQLVRLAPAGRHFAFEPLPELAADLRRRFPGVEVHEAALAGQPGTARFHRALDAHSRSSLRGDVVSDLQTTTLDVTVETLDGVIPEDLRVDVLKIDVEGAQLDVLRGAARVLGRDQPTVILEHGGPGPEDREVFDCLTGAGLRVFDMDGGGPHDFSSFSAALGARRRRWNWIAHR